MVLAFNADPFSSRCRFSIFNRCAPGPVLWDDGFATAASLTFDGTLSDPNQIVQIIFTLDSTSSVTIQTTSWKAGNFDPVLWLFDSAGNQVTKDDDTCNGVGCSPINRDSFVQVAALGPGTYTAFLSTWDQHFWRAIAAGNPPGVVVTGWSYLGGFWGLPPNYSLTLMTSANINPPYVQVIFPPSNNGPDAPVLVSPVKGAAGVPVTPTLNWTTVSGTNGYALYLGTTNPVTASTQVTGPPFTPATALSPGTTYYWKVASRDPNNNNTENPSLVSSFTTATPPPPPPPPVQISPGSGTTGLSLRPTLSWNASSGSAGYNVYLGTTNPPATSHFTTNLSYTPDTPLSSGATYYWKVASRDPNNNNAESPSTVWSFTTAQPLPPPTLMSPGNGATGIASTSSITWNPVSGSAGYMVYLGTTNPPTVSFFTTASSFSPSIPLTTGTQYSWRVASRDPNNNNAESSSATWSFTTAPPLPAPTLLTPADAAAAVPVATSLSWNAVNGSAGYSVYLGTTNPPTASTLSSTASFTPATPLVGGTTYYWMVASRDPNNNNKEAASAVRSFTTVATPLAAPILVSPAIGATGLSVTPNLTWGPVTGTAGYSVYLGTTTPPAALIQTNATSLTPSAALTPATTYYWMVASRDPNNNNKESASAIWSFTTAPALPAPSLTSPSNGATSVSSTTGLAWTAVPGTAGYSVYLGTSNPPTLSTLVNNASFTPSAALAAGTTYYWMVASRDPNNNNKESASSVWSFTTAPALPAPALGSPANAATGVLTSASLNWNAVPGTAGYLLYLGTSNPPTSPVPVSGTSFTPTATLSPGTVYYWKVSSIDPNNNNREAASVVWSFTTAVSSVYGYQRRIPIDHTKVPNAGSDEFPIPVQHHRRHAQEREQRRARKQPERLRCHFYV